MTGRVCLLALLAGCVSVADPYPALGVPAWYEPLYATVCACAGVGGDFNDIAWRTVEGDGWEHPDHGWIVGFWKPPHSIWLAESMIDNAWLVSHEMLHDCLQRTGHPSPPFGVCDPGHTA